MSYISSSGRGKSNFALFSLSFKMSRLKCIVGSFIALVVIIIAGVGMYYAVTLNGESESEDIHPDAPGAMLLASTTDGRILQLDPNLGNYTTIVEEDSHIQCFDYMLGYDVLFYATDEPNEPIKVVSNWNNLTMNCSAPWTKTAMATDFFNRQLFVLDGLDEKLYAININSGDYFVFLENLNKPRDVVVDTERTLMFILEESSVLMINTRTGTVDSSNNFHVRALAVDYNNDKVYFANDEVIVSMNFHDNERARYEQRYVLRMTVFQGNLLYINNPEDGSKKSLNKCSKGCETVETLEIDDGQVSLLSNIKAYDLIYYADQ